MVCVRLKYICNNRHDDGGSLSFEHGRKTDSFSEKIKMNDTGCPEGYRTDQLLLYQVHIPLSEVSVLGYAIWSAILIFFRPMITFEAWRAWIRFVSRAASRSKTYRQRRTPFQRFS